MRRRDARLRRERLARQERLARAARQREAREVEARSVYGFGAVRTDDAPAIVVDSGDQTASDRIETGVMRLIDRIGFPLFAIGCSVVMAICVVLAFG
jgi:hypothetical protein